MMRRRDFLKSTAAAALSSWVTPHLSRGEDLPATAPAGAFRGEVEDFFLQILRGFLRNARATADSYVVCDFPQGTKLKGCCAPNGKTYVSVARMLPAMADFLAARREPAVFDIDGRHVDLREVC